MRKKKKSIIKFLYEETKKKVILKFLIVLLLILSYLFFAVAHYGIKDGILATLLTWSMFVLCTPISDAGFLIDFPIRLFTDIKMIYSELTVWVIAIILNLLTYFCNPEVYSKTPLLKIFKIILMNPFPYWAIILLSAIGTYISVYFGDELMDKAFHKDRLMYHQHKRKQRILIGLFFFTFVILSYYFLVHHLGLNF